MAENLNLLDINELLLPKIHNHNSPRADLLCDSDKSLGHEPLYGVRQKREENQLQHLLAEPTAPETPTGNDFSFMSPISPENESLRVLSDEKIDLSSVKADRDTSDKLMMCEPT